MATHTMQKMEFFLEVAKEYGFNINAVFGAHSNAEELHAVLGHKLRVPKHKGVIH
jgi:hypothetical protein